MIDPAVFYSDEPADWHDLPEEKMLAKVRELQVSILAQFPLGKDLDEAMRCCRDLKGYFLNAIENRNAPLPCDDVDADFRDPFADEEPA